MMIPEKDSVLQKIKTKLQKNPNQQRKTSNIPSLSKDYWHYLKSEGFINILAFPNLNNADANLDTCVQSDPKEDSSDNFTCRRLRTGYKVFFEILKTQLRSAWKTGP